MRAGGLSDTWLQLQRPERNTDAMGSERVNYVDAQRVHAERIKFSGRRLEEACEHFSDYTAEYNIRWAHNVSDGWRALDEDSGILYLITSVLPNRRKGYKTLRCERVNE